MQPEVFGGRYHAVRPIGRGGMGTVWLCRDETLAREVAVKQVGRLPGDFDTDTARAIREARSTAALNHRNVVTVFDVLREDGSIWLVMEHVPSRTLSQVIREEGRLSPARAAGIGAQVADGLAAAHAAGITHRDVKPGNVLVTTDGTAKIGDFGISRAAGEPALTQSGLVTGTPSYFSPELARGADPNPAADVWALGATLYAAVEGRPLYRAHDNPVAVLHEIASQPPPAPRKAGPLGPVLTRMLDRDPTTRWSMEDAAHALQRITERERTAALTRELPMTVPVTVDRPASTRQDPGGSPTTALSSRAAGSTAEQPTKASADGPPTVGPSRPAEPPRPRLRAQPQPDPTRAWSGDDPARASSGGRAHGWRLVLVGIVALALALLTVILVDRTTGTDNPEPQTGSTTSDQPTPGETSSPADGADRGSNGDRNGGDTPRTQSTPSPVGGGAATFVDQYFDTVPTDLDTGWQMLSPDYQAETGGRSTYDGFWGTIQSVDATNISRVPGGDSVEATVTYTYDDGRIATERQRIYLVSSPSGLLIGGYDTL